VKPDVSGWRLLSSVKVINGTVKQVPNAFYTGGEDGTASNKGWILGGPDLKPGGPYTTPKSTFALSYSSNSEWDSCSGNQPLTGKERAELSYTVTDIVRDTPYYSCKDALAQGEKDSGMFHVNFGNYNNSFPVLCDMSTSGGGWTLLLTVKDPTKDLPGDVGVSPFENEQNEKAPSLKTPYGRIWGSHDGGVGLVPASGDEILLVRTSDNDHVRMVIDTWCGGSGWRGFQSTTCGSTGLDLLGLANGKLYDKDEDQISGSFNFHSCSHVGGCGGSPNGGDGVGFSTHNQWLHGANNAYGGAYDGGSGAHLYWAGKKLSAGSDVFAYYYREK